MRFLIRHLRQWFQGGSAQAISAERARARVQKGAAYLDDADPGWHRRIDPAALELAAGESCILGQLHGTFRMGLGRSRLIDLSSAPRASLSPVEHGFQCVSGLSPEDEARDYALLDRAWQDAIRRRRAQDARAAPAVDAGDRHPRPGPDGTGRAEQPPASEPARPR